MTELIIYILYLSYNILVLLLPLETCEYYRRLLVCWLGMLILRQDQCICMLFAILFQFAVLFVLSLSTHFRSYRDDAWL